MKTQYWLFFFLLFSLMTALEARENKQKIWLNQTFKQSIPRPKRLKLFPENQQQVKKILGHPYYLKRIKYWEKNQKRAWVLNEVGKTKFITAGFVIEQGTITQSQVLKFRESRGSEIQAPFFTQQLTQSHLTPSYQLDKSIDGITGATLSVRAMTKMARLALFLDQILVKKYP